MYSRETKYKSINQSIKSLEIRNLYNAQKNQNWKGEEKRQPFITWPKPIYVVQFKGLFRPQKYRRKFAMQCRKKQQDPGLHVHGEGDREFWCMEGNELLIKAQSLSLDSSCNLHLHGLHTRSNKPLCTYVVFLAWKGFLKPFQIK